MSKKPKAVKTATTKETPKPQVKKAAASPQKVNGASGENSKRFLLLELLHRPEGATLEELMDITGWQQHSVRGFLSGTVKKKLGLKLLSEKAKGDIRIYQIKAK